MITALKKSPFIKGFLQFKPRRMIVQILMYFFFLYVYPTLGGLAKLQR